MSSSIQIADATAVQVEDDIVKDIGCMLYDTTGQFLPLGKRFGFKLQNQATDSY